MPTTRSNTTLQVSLCLVTGVLVFLAYPGWNYDFLAWFAFVPLLVACRDVSVKRAFWLGLLAGTVTNAGGFWWMTQMLRDFGHLPAPVAWAILVLQAVTQGVAFAIGTAAWRWFVERGGPVAWSAMLSLWLGEVITPMIFPWFLGNAISNETMFVQTAELGGVHVLSAMLYASNAAIFEVFLGARAKRPTGWGMVATTALWVVFAAGFGLYRIADVQARQEAAAKLKIGLVEGNIGIWEKQAQHLRGQERVQMLRNNLLIHQQMSKDLEKQGAELILWPESAYMPYGPVPVLFSQGSMAAVGEGGFVAHEKAATLVPYPHTSNVEPAKSPDLRGLSSPRGDVLRFLAGSQTVVTRARWHTHTVEAPKGETFVDTAAGPVNMFGDMPAGLVAAKSGKLWTLRFAPEPLERDPPQKPEPMPLIEIPGHNIENVEIEAIGRAGSGAAWMVGKKGAMLRVLGNSVQAADSPTDVDLHDVAGDPLGSELTAVGDNGTIVAMYGGLASVVSRGGKHLRATWYCPDGSVWAGGDEATLLRRKPRGRWERVAFKRQDETRRAGRRMITSGACDADNQVAVVIDGQVWRAEGDRGFAQIPGNGTRNVHDIVAFHPKASYTIPRSAKRIMPSSAGLPAKSVPFPQNVIADEVLPEFDRSSPRRGFRTPLLFGALTYGGVLPARNNDCRACYNSALLIDGNGTILEMTDKAFLLVFGEYMPFGERFPELYELLPESSRFQPGTRTRPMVLGNARIGVVVCYEDLLPRQTMKVAAHDPNVFVNLTNDAWFGQTAEPEHHLQLAQLRTVEYRRWLVRSTNTGISVFIDALGRRQQETALTGAETLLMDVPLLEGKTVYAMLGDWPKVVLLIVVLLLGARGILRGPTSQPRRKKPGKSATKASKPKKTSKPPEKLKPQKLS